MRNPTYAQPFITDHRIQFAVNLANEFAEKDHLATAYECAEKAVRKIFGRWLLDYAGSVKPNFLPLFLRLACDVEQRMGLHRRRKPHAFPNQPAAAAWPVIFNHLEVRPEPRAMVA